MCGRKVEIVYDSCRAYVSLNVLELFELSGIIVYALPAATSGKTQSLGKFVSSLFKNRDVQLHESIC